MKYSSLFYILVAVITPITVSIGISFRRREHALFHISRVRSFAFQMYLAHAIWNWDGGKGKNKAIINGATGTAKSTFTTTSKSSSARSKKRNQSGSITPI